MTRSGPPEGRGSFVLYVHCGSFDPAAYPRVLELLGEFTPTVEAVPPDAALADVREAVRFFDRLPEQLALMMRIRAAALCDARLTIGIGPNPMLAEMAAADGPPYRIRLVGDDTASVDAFLRPKPVAALPGMSARTALALEREGLRTVGQVADAPLATVERVLGPDTAGAVAAWAHGFDPRRVAPQILPRSMSAERLLDADSVTAVEVRGEVLALADHLGSRLRASGQAAGALALTVRFNDHSTVTRTRALAGPTQAAGALAEAADQVLAGFAPQRARVRLVLLRAEALSPEVPSPEVPSPEVRSSQAPSPERDQRQGPYGYEHGGEPGGEHGYGQGHQQLPLPDPDSAQTDEPGGERHLEAVAEHPGGRFGARPVFPGAFLRADEPKSAWT